MTRRGLLWMLGATASLVAMNSCAKLLREDGFSTAEIIFYRTTPGVMWLWLDLRRRRRPLRPVRRDLVLLRSGLGIAAMAANFYAVRALNLVQHQALHLLQPVFVALFAPLLLRERLHGVVLLALVFAVSGSLLVLAPQGEISSLPLVPAMVGASGAISSALAHVTIRKTSETEAAEVVVLHFALHASLFGLLWGISSGDFQLRRFTLETLLMAGSTATFGTLGQLWMTRAYGLAPASRVALVGYAAIPLSLGVDVTVWGTHVELVSLLGAGVLAFAGYLLARKPAAQPGQP